MICGFCTNPENKARMIAENDHAWSFLSYLPIVPGHTLVIPKRCVQRIEDLTDEERDAIFALSTKIKNALKKAFNTYGFNHAWNEGEKAGQTVPHFHLHIVPRKDADDGVATYEPREFLYRPGSRAISPQAELLEVTEMIKASL